jgi:hypothetical protein
MAGNWWFDNQGRNNLAGIPGDEDNPAILPDHVIVDMLIRVPIAKRDFVILVPTMLPGEQVRLNGLTAMNPLTLQPFPFNDQQVEDQFMRSQNVPGVHDPNNRRKKQW